MVRAANRFDEILRAIREMNNPDLQPILNAIQNLQINPPAPVAPEGAALPAVRPPPLEPDLGQPSITRKSYRHQVSLNSNLIRYLEEAATLEDPRVDINLVKEELLRPNQMLKTADKVPGFFNLVAQQEIVSNVIDEF